MKLLGFSIIWAPLKNQILYWDLSLTFLKNWRAEVVLMMENNIDFL